LAKSVWQDGTENLEDLTGTTTAAHSCRASCSSCTSARGAATQVYTIYWKLRACELDIMFEECLQGAFFVGLRRALSISDHISCLDALGSVLTAADESKRRFSP
jgi:hypothetical protein